MPQRPYQSAVGYDTNPTLPAAPPEIKQPKDLAEWVGNTFSGAVDTTVAGFRLENDVVNGLELLSRPAFQPEPDFNLEGTLRGEGLWDQYKWNFIGVDSRPEYDYVLAKIRREEKDRETLAAAGVGGFVAQLAAGVLSPTLFLPFIGELRGAKAVASGAGWGFAGGLAQEIPLQLNQETRTIEESAFSVGMSTVVGGLLGGAVAYLSRPLEDVARDMADIPGKEAIPEAPFASIGPKASSVGAQAAPPRVSAGGLADALGQQDEFLGKLSPVTRVLSSTSQTAQWMMAQLSDAGLALRGNIEGIATSVGGTAENNILVHWAKGADTVRLVDDAFARYQLGRKSQGIADRVNVWISGVRPRNGKLSKKQFKEAVGRAMFNKDEGAIPEVAEVAAFVRKRVYDNLYELAKEVDIYRRTDDAGNEIDLDAVLGDLSYLNRDYRQEVIAARRTEFVDILTKHFAERLGRDYSAELGKLLEQMAKEQDKLADMRRSPNEVEELKADFQQQLDDLNASRTEEEVALDDYIADLRSLGYDKKLSPEQRKDARDMAKMLSKTGGASERQKQRREIKRRLSNLNRSFAMRNAQLAKKLERLYRIEELSLNTMQRTVRSAQKFLRQAEQLTDEKFAEEISKLKDKFAKVGEQYDKGEERISSLVSEVPEYADLLNNTPPVQPRAPEFEVAAKELPDDVAREFAVWENRSLFEDVKANLLEDLNKVAEMLPEPLYKKLLAVFPENGTFSPKAWDEFSSAIELYEKNNVKLPDEVEDFILAYEMGGFDSSYRVQNSIKLAKQEYPEYLKATRDNLYNIWGRDPQVLLGGIEDWIAAHKQALKDPESMSGGWFRDPRELFVLEQLALEQRVKLAANQANPAAAGDPTASKLLGAAEKQYDRARKLTQIAEELEYVEQLDRESLRLLVNEGLDELLVKTNRINGRRFARAERLRDEVANLDPKIIEAEINNLRKTMDDRTSAFFDRWQENGASKIELRPDSTPDFRTYAKEVAETATTRILGTNARLAGMDLIMEPKGAQLARVLDIDSNLIMDFLETDIERLTSQYIRTLAPDIEIRKKLGEYAPDFGRNEEFTKLNQEESDRLRTLQTEMKAAGKSQEEIDAASKKLNNEYRTIRRDLEAVIGRLRHKWGIPTDPQSFATRAGRIAMNLNVLRYMNMVTVSSIPDLAMPIMKYGMMRTFRDGWVPFIKQLSQLKLNVRELQLAGAALDVLLHSRAHQISDVGDYMVRGSKFEKGLEWASSKIGMVALFDYWTVAMKQIAGSVANAKALDDIRVLLDPTRKGTKAEIAKSTNFLAGAGINEDLARAIWDELRKPGGSDMVDGVLWPNTEAWDNSRGAVDAYRALLVREVNRTIITPGVERPLMTDSSLAGRLLFQFKSFSLSATQKIFLAGLQQRDMAVAQGTMISLALGALSYYIWANITGGKALEDMNAALEDFDGEGWKKFADESISRSGILASISMGQDIMSTLPMVGPYSTLSGQRSSRQADNDFIDATLGPSLDLARRAIRAMPGVDSETGNVQWDRSNMHQLRLMLPFQNHFALRHIFNAIEQAVPEID